jgi:hypothetical protein
MEQMQELQAQVAAQETELQQYAENDPETLAKMVEATNVGHRLTVCARMVASCVQSGSLSRAHTSTAGETEAAISCLPRTCHGCPLLIGAHEC